MSSSKVTNEERLAAAHDALTAAVAKVATSEDWQNLLRISGSFRRYSPNNQLLLAAQGAQGVVASFHTWKQIPAVDGQMCRIRKGETAVRVYAPIKTRREELDEATGEQPKPSVVGFKLVPVFHEAQLVAPPDLPAQPKLLDGDDPPPIVWEAIAAQINAAGYILERGPLEGQTGAKGVTKFLERTVVVRDDLAPAQALKTEIHELGHVLMHVAEVREPGLRDRMEVEAESVAYVVCDLLGVDAGAYSIPYVANWAGADVELVQETARKVLDTARTIVADLEAELGVDLRPNLIADAINASRAVAAESSPSPRVLVGGGGTTDQLIHDHLATGPLHWPRLAASIPGLEAHRSQMLDDKPEAQAIVLAEAGASPEATVAVLRAHGLDDSTVRAMLTVTVPDVLGAMSTLFDRDEVERAVRDRRPVKPIPDAIVADLLVAAGQHPTGARHLAETSGQPASVINLMEERLRRSDPQQSSVADRRSSRGLALIDEWAGESPTSRLVSVDGPSMQPHPPDPAA